MKEILNFLQKLNDRYPPKENCGNGIIYRQGKLSITMAPPIMRYYTLDLDDYSKTMEDLLKELYVLIDEDIKK